jgi:hypothetical protein
MMIRHKVADFDQWKPVYEDHRPARQAAGLEDLHLWRNQNDPHDVVIVFTVSDTAKAKEFIGSADLKDAMLAAGVVGPPGMVMLSES